MQELPQPGEILRQKYRVEGVLGRGGMAVVVAAVHLHLGQRVAIKLMRWDVPRERDVVERFLREARAAGRLEGEHVARVIDVDSLPDGMPFIVMEHLDGQDLGALLCERRLSIPEAVDYVRQACLAIAEAHALGIVHRDVKPANLFLARRRTGEPLIKVLDFGISKLLEDTRLTEQQVGMGSAEYTSPEQLRSARDVDARADIWSLGVTLYELCTGETPFHAEGVSNVLIAVMAKAPVPPRRLRPDMPPALDAVIMRCLEKEPSRRFATVAELSAALAPFAPATAAAPSPPAKLSTPAWMRAHVALVGAALGALAVLLVILAFVAGRGREGGAAGKTPAAPPATERTRLDGDVLVDRETRLNWMRQPAPGAMDWKAAKAYCARRHYRLPARLELDALYALVALEPPTEEFPRSPVDVFWSGTEAPDGRGAMWVKHFSDGRWTSSVVSSPNRVRCVR